MCVILFRVCIYCSLIFYVYKWSVNNVNLFGELDFWGIKIFFYYYVMWCYFNSYVLFLRFIWRCLKIVYNIENFCLSLM